MIWDSRSRDGASISKVDVPVCGPSRCLHGGHVNDDRSNRGLVPYRTGCQTASRTIARREPYPLSVRTLNNQLGVGVVKKDEETLITVWLPQLLRLLLYSSFVVWALTSKEKFLSIIKVNSSQRNNNKPSYLPGL